MNEWYRMKTSVDNKHSSMESSVDTSCEMTDPYNIFSDNLSPIRAPIMPRKLDFSSSNDDEDSRSASPPPISQSPPYKRVRALRYVYQLSAFTFIIIIDKTPRYIKIKYI